MAHPMPATESASYRAKKSPKVLEHIRLIPAENKGVSVEHHFTEYEHKPETHVFAANQGKELMAHIQEHMGMGDGEEKES